MNKYILHNCFVILLLLAIQGRASVYLDQNRPDNVSEQKWSSLRMAAREVKLLPLGESFDATNSSFGWSVSVDGDKAIIGAPVVGMDGIGLAFLMEFNGATWERMAVLQPDDGEANDLFGSSVSLSGDRALVGAYQDNDNGINSGSVYVFEFDGTSWNQSNKLKANDGAEGDSFGISVSVTGTRALIGAYRDIDKGDNSGSAYVFEFDGVNWNQTNKLNAIDGAEGDLFGNAVSLSGDRALIGAYGDDDNGSDSGSAYVFDYDGMNWIQSTKLVGNTGTTSDRFGFSVSVSGDLVLVGAYGNDANGLDSGTSYLFSNDGFSWSLETTLNPNDGASNDRFGYSVSLSGSQALVGAYGDDDNGSASGSAYIFNHDGNAWIQEKLLSNDGEESNFFGHSVSLSGNRAIIGAYGDTDSGFISGSAFSFNFNNQTWVESPKISTYDGPIGNYFGGSVSISGNRALVGAAQDESSGGLSGAAYVFDFDGTNWVQTAKLVADDGASFDQFGENVSLQGNRALVAASGDDDARGGVYVFDYDGLKWSQSAKLIASDGESVDQFGYSVSLSVDRALIGAYRDDDNGTWSGAAYVFDYDGSSWNESQKLIAFDGTENDNFGSAVSLLGDRALIGAPGDGVNGTLSGSAYVFDFDGLNWSETAKLTPGDGTTNDFFGNSVSLSSDRLLVGAPFDSDIGLILGAAYVYSYDGINWLESSKIVVNDGGEFQTFGISVSLEGDRALIGAYQDNTNGGNAGSAYLFTFDDENWVQSEKLLPTDPQLNGKFGFSVSMSGGHLLVGARGVDENSGAAYVFNSDLIFQNGFESN